MNSIAATHSSIPHTSIRERQRINFDSKHLMLPALFCMWLLIFSNYSPPDDWRMSRFGTVPILSPKILTLMKFLGRGGTGALICFSLLSVWKYEKTRYVLAVMAPLLVFGAYGMSSTAWSALKSISLLQSVTFMTLILLATYIGIVWRSDLDTERIVKHLALSLFVMSLLLLALRLGMPRSGALTKESAGVLHSTNSCAAGGLCILLTLAARLLWRSPWSTWWLPIVSIEFVMMLIAGNRLSVIVTALAVLLILAHSMNRGIAALMLLVLSLTFGSYLVLDPGLTLVESVSKEVGVFAKQGQSKSELGSISGRAEMWDKMWRSYWKSPIIGHGFFVTTQKGRIYVWHEWGNWTAHNVVLQTLVTTGAVGLLLLTLGLISLGLGVIKGFRSLTGVGNSVTVLAVTAFWYFGWGFLNESFVGPLLPEVVVFAALAGVAAGIGGSAHWSMQGGISDFETLKVQNG